MAYDGTVQLIAGITQKNGGNFPLVDATAVRIDDTMRLGVVLELFQDTINDTRQVIVKTGDTITGIQHIRGNTVIRTDTFALSGYPMVETRTLNTGERLTISTDLTTLTSTITYTPAQA